MKILREGRPQQGWAIEQECIGTGHGGGGCGALLLVELADLRLTGSGADHDRDVSITCPSCGIVTNLTATSRLMRDAATRNTFG